MQVTHSPEYSLDGAELLEDLSPARIQRRRLARAYLIWALGLLTYVVAVAGRNSFGFAADLAVPRFGVNATALSMFGVLQLGTYAAAQFPVGLLLDRYGARLLLLGGSALMLTGQAALAVSDSLGLALAARVMIGAGDAAVFISVLRLVASWFPARRVPLMTQLTGVIGQLGQVVAAVPFYAVLVHAGWTAAFGSLAALLLVVILLLAVGLSNEPDGLPTGAIPVLRSSPTAVLRDVLTSPGAWGGMFIHATGLTMLNMFTVLWGVPMLVIGHGLAPAEAGALMTITVGMTIVLGPTIGAITGARPHLRLPIVGVLLVVCLGLWAVMLAIPGQLPMLALVPMMLALSLGGSWNNVGFDVARTAVSPMSVGTSSGFVNIGGFTGGLAATFIVGRVLDVRSPDGDYQLSDFRIGFALALSVVVLAAIGAAICHLIALRRERATRTASRPTGTVPAVRDGAGELAGKGAPADGVVDGASAGGAVGGAPAGGASGAASAVAGRDGTGRTAADHLAHLSIRPADFGSAELAAFIDAHIADAVAIDPTRGAVTPTLEDLRRRDAIMFSAHVSEGDGRPAHIVAAVALRPVAGEVGHWELCSLRVDPEHARRGIGTRMLLHAVGAAHDLSARRVSLETGSADDFAGARRLFARHGFTETGPFGSYEETPHAVFMTRELR